MTGRAQDPHILTEIRETPAVVRRLLTEGAPSAERLAAALRNRPPRFAVTVARGSSDHACTVLKYALETELGLVTASAAPSVLTVYGAAPNVEGALVLAVSQSGRSPDVVRTLAAARERGALTVAAVNQEDSPLAEAAEFVLPLLAGEERAVAATKSYVASLAAVLAVVARLRPGSGVAEGLQQLPGALEDTLRAEEEAARRAERYRYSDTVVTLARGAHFGVAQELALKLKETGELHAEAFSAAEFAHGPIILAEGGLPIVALQSRDAAAPGTAELYRDLAGRGAELVLVGDAEADVPASVRLGAAPTGHFLTDALPSAVVGYLFAAHVSLARGLNPDAPRALRKVTQTL